MRYVVLLSVVTILIIAAYVMLDRRGDSSDGDESVEISSDSWVNYNQVIWKHNEPKDIVGCSLPPSISNLNCYCDFSEDLGISGEGVGVKSNWLVAEISSDEFRSLVQGLGLSIAPDLGEIWPEVFECTPEFSDKWCVSKSVDTDTFFGKDADRRSFVVLKYEGGKMFVKRATYYEIKMGSDRQMLLRVITKKDNEG